MKALIREESRLILKEIPRPIIKTDDEVMIRVMIAGICRTDIYAAEGRLKTRPSIVLGHEFSGVIAETGARVASLSIGDRVTVMPIIGCRDCLECRNDDPFNCANRAMLGIDYPGAFAEYIVVPAQTVYRLPASISFKAGAYIEPIAASLAVLKTGINPSEKGLIFGDNRIARLTKKVLAAHGFSDISIYDPADSSQLLESAGFDFIIETLATTASLKEMIRAARAKAKIILKSRQFQPVELDLISIIKKELTFQAVNYGAFSEALTLLANGKLQVEDMFGELYRLKDYQQAFQTASTADSLKTFFTLAE